MRGPEPSVADLKSLAQMRFDDAFFLSTQQRHSVAYYLAGYAIECALKAIIAQSFRSGVIPDKRLVNELYTHDLVKLVGLAGLSAELRVAQGASPAFQANWGIVSGWTEAARYELIDPFTSTRMIGAVGELDDGVLEWLKKLW
jgi:hypothetical protein